MITREEALRRLEAVANEPVALRTALAEGWTETPVEAPIQALAAQRRPDQEVLVRETQRVLAPCEAI